MSPTVFFMTLAMPLMAWLTVNWMKMRRADSTVHRSDPDADRKIALLTGENEKLHGRIGRLEERIAVLERIVTDGAHSLTREIEQLRDPAN